MSTIFAIIIIALFGMLFTAMAIAPALIESAASSPLARPRLVVVESPPSLDGDDGEPRAA